MSLDQAVSARPASGRCADAEGRHRPGRHQHHPHPGHRRGGEGRLRPRRRADGLAPVAYTLWTRFLNYDPAGRCGRTATASCSPTGTPRCCSTRCCSWPAWRRPTATASRRPGGRQPRRHQGVPRARQRHARPPRARPHHRRGDHHRAARPGRRRQRRHGDGRALARRALQPARPRALRLHVYVICSDGDLMEGISGEAASLAGHLKLSNLSGSTTTTTSRSRARPTSRSPRTSPALPGLRLGDPARRRRQRLRGGRPAIEAFQATGDRPTLIRVRSVIGYGSPHKQGTSKIHCDPLGADEVKATKRELGWPEDAQFLVPDGVAQRFDESLGARGRAAARGVGRPPGAYAKAFPDLAAELEPMRRRRAAGGLGRRPPELRGRRQGHRHARGVRQGAERDRAKAAVAARRLGRPRAVEQDHAGVRRRARLRARTTTAAATCTSASAST